MSTNKNAVMRDHDHLGMIKNPSFWPAWPVLPVKRNGVDYFKDDRALGYMLDAAGAENKVFIGDIFLMSKDDEFLTYDSPEAIVADGWVVD